jgi:hypothetical protein
MGKNSFIPLEGWSATIRIVAFFVDFPRSAMRAPLVTSMQEEAETQAGDEDFWTV